MNYDAFTFLSTTQNDVNRIVNSLPSNKAVRYDKVMAKILQNSLPATVPAITNLKNYSFLSCGILHKSGNKQWSYRTKNL